MRFFDIDIQINLVYNGDMKNKILKRGLASSSIKIRKQVASLGGRAAQLSGRAHMLTREERSKGGKHSSGNFANRSREEVQQIGRKGGIARHKK